MEAKTPAEARTGLIARFGMTDIQADEVLKLQLQRLTGLERQKIVDELREIRILIADLRDILSNPKRLDGIVADELKKIRDEQGDPRRTEIQDAVEERRLPHEDGRHISSDRPDEQEQDDQDDRNLQDVKRHTTPQNFSGRNSA